MGATANDSQPAAARGVAVFDLDGTITWRDTLLPYLGAALRRYPVRVLRLWPAPFVVARFVLDRDRGRLKASLIRAVLGGLSRAAVAALTKAFLDGRLGSLVRPGAIAAIERHRAAGDYLVILSASTDFYVPEIGRRLGFDEVICTEVVWRDGCLDGALASANRRDAEKTRCLAGLRLRHPGARIAAYGNAGSDLDHLGRADAPLLVNASSGTRRRAVALGIHCADWT